MAQMGEIQHRGAVDDIKGVMNYVYQLEEQIRYVLANLGSDNLAPGSVDVAQLGPNITKQFTTIIQGQEDLGQYARKKVEKIEDEFGNYSTTSQTEAYIAGYVTNALGDYSTTTQTAQAISTYVTNALGDYSTTQQTAQAISAYVTNALGDYSTTQQTAQAISTYVSSALGDYSTTQQTAQAISNYVTNALGSYSTTSQTASMISTAITNSETTAGQTYIAKTTQYQTAASIVLAAESYTDDNAYLKQSGIDINANGVDITGSKYVKIRSGASFDLVSTNLEINSTSGIIEASYNGTTYFKIGAGRTQLLGLDLYSSYESGYTDVTSTITNLDYYGWIRNASVSGNTLTLTKWNGTTINFNKAGSNFGSIALESVSGNTAQFKAVAKDTSSAVLGSKTGEIYLDDTAANYSRSTWACVKPANGSRIAYKSLADYWDAAQAAASGGKTVTDVIGKITSGETYNSQTGIWGAKMRVTVYYSDNTYEVFTDKDLNTSYLHS